MRNALLTVIVLTLILVQPACSCGLEDEKTPSSGPSDPADGETGVAEPEAPKPPAATGETGSPDPDMSCTQLLTECRIELELCSGAK